MSLQTDNNDNSNDEGPAVAISSTSGSKKKKIQPRRLELSLSPEDGSLLTCPLSRVLIASTDGLYTDLYNMCMGEIQVPIDTENNNNNNSGNNNNNASDGAAASGGGATPGGAGNAAVGASLVKHGLKTERMSNLSFAQRRHELAWRLAQHGKALTHVAALTAANAMSNTSHHHQFLHGGSSSSSLEFQFSRATHISTKALQHARTAWVQADEAQDALYFFHAQLFPVRQAPHDVYGALDLLMPVHDEENEEEKPSKNNDNDANAAADNNNDDSDRASTNAGGGGGPSVPKSVGWKDLPSDLRLVTDRYETSREQSWSAQEVEERWHMAVRDKLLRGEVGRYMAPGAQPPEQQREQQHWKISLQGGVVRLTHGQPKAQMLTQHQQQQQQSSSFGKQNLLYPMEAYVSVLSTAVPAQWTLLSIQVRVQSKTGESNHQLDTTSKQQYDLHRLCVKAMEKEEALAATATDALQEDQNGDGDNTDQIMSTAGTSSFTSRPLQRLFDVAHYFSLCWQLEVLNAQAQALKRGGGVWSSQANLVVTPIRFFGHGGDGDKNKNNDDDDDNQKQSAYDSLFAIMSSPTPMTIGIVSVSFWTIDDRYGAPSISELDTTQRVDEEDDHHNQDENNPQQDAKSTTSSSHHDADDDEQRIKDHKPPTNKLTLSIRAVTSVGIRVSLSGAKDIMATAAETSGDSGNDENCPTRDSIRKLMEATSNPFALSASNALLYATLLCAEQRCYAMVQALNTSLNASGQDASGNASLLAPYVTIFAERSSIAIAVRVSYNNDGGSLSSSPPVVLFRLACDVRTGTFVSTFCRSTKLLQLLASNDPTCSNAIALRIAKAASIMANAATPSNVRGSTNTKAIKASKISKMMALHTAKSAGRFVKDAFESLVRSMNVLGTRVWDCSAGNASISPLRQRSIQNACRDVNAALQTCCGMAVMYGLSAIALGVATGITAQADLAGGPIAETGKPTSARSDSPSLLAVPPVGVVLDQDMVQKTYVTRDGGETKKQSYLKRQIFCMTCAQGANAIVLRPYLVTATVDSPSADSNRVACEAMEWKCVDKILNQNHFTMDAGSEPPTKKMRTESENADSNGVVDLMVVVNQLAQMIQLLVNE